MEDLVDQGFVRVSCPECERPDVWLRCESCDKSDHFLFDGESVSCDCGATYAHAVCLCGAEVPPEHLTFVSWDEGPMALADLEWDVKRLVVAGAVACVVLGGGAWAVWTWLL